MTDASHAKRGYARAEALSPERRAEIASQDAAARWAGVEKTRARTIRISGETLDALEAYAERRGVSIASAAAGLIAEGVGK